MVGLNKSHEQSHEQSHDQSKNFPKVKLHIQCDQS